MKWTIGAVALAIGLSAQSAAAQFSDVAGGKRHDATGLVCPVSASGFELKTAEEANGGFHCRYEMRCRAAEGCSDAIGFATVGWEPKRDVAADFLALAVSQGLRLAEPKGPKWAGAPQMVAHGGTGANESHAGWWRISAQRGPLDIGIMYNRAAETAAKELVGATVLANR